MKTMAAVNIGVYENVDRSLTAYYRTIEDGLTAILRHYQPPPAGKPATGGCVGAVIFGSDQGMVGPFNDNLARAALDRLSPVHDDLSVWCVGERVGLKLQDELSLRRVYRVPGSATGITSLVASLLSEVAAQEESGKLDELIVIFNSPTARAGYETAVQTLLPVDPGWLVRLGRKPWPTRLMPQTLMAAAETIASLIREHLLIKLCWACAESLVSENIARLAAMQRAGRNIEEILGELTVGYNQERQNAITAELFDVVFGYDVLADENAK